MTDLMGLEVELTLTIAELVDLIECGAVTTNSTGYEPPIIEDLRTHFTRLVQGLNEAADEV